VQPSAGFNTGFTSGANATTLVHQATLTIELTDLRNCQGVLCVALFSSPEGYPNDSTQAVRSGCFAIETLPCLVTFADLPYGWYAATVHHDENMDGQLNCNALGIPKEGVGFSGNPRIWKGVPAFAKAAFEFSPDSPQISISLKYLLK
jgi:uncharacterized protein (DUF2141 family)